MKCLGRLGIGKIQRQPVGLGRGLQFHGVVTQPVEPPGTDYLAHGGGVAHIGRLGLINPIHLREITTPPCQTSWFATQTSRTPLSEICSQCSEVSWKTEGEPSAR